MTTLGPDDLQAMGIDANTKIETWESINQKSVKLAQMIIDSLKDAAPSELFDKVVTIPKGGLYPANIVTREIGCKGTDILSAAMGSYASGVDKRKNEISYGQMPTAEEVRGKNLLIIDEVCDSGKTLLDLVNKLKQMGATKVMTAVIHYKPGKSETGFVPDWFVKKTDSWVVYPWEISEYNGKNSKPKIMKNPLWMDQ